MRHEKILRRLREENRADGAGHETSGWRATSESECTGSVAYPARPPGLYMGRARPLQF